MNNRCGAPKSIFLNYMYAWMGLNEQHVTSEAVVTLTAPGGVPHRPSGDKRVKEANEAI